MCDADSREELSASAGAFPAVVNFNGARAALHAAIQAARTILATANK